MRRRFAVLAVTMLIAAGCESSNTAEPFAGTPSFSAQSVRGTATFNQDFTGPIECAGEDVRFVFQVPMTLHQVSTPNGTHTTIHFVDQGATGTATGQTTGRTWTLKQIALTLNDIDAATGVVHYVGRGIWTSEEGPTIYNFELLNLRIDQDGNVVTNDFTLRFTCH